MTKRGKAQKIPKQLYKKLRRLRGGSHLEAKQESSPIEGQTAYIGYDEILKDAIDCDYLALANGNIAVLCQKLGDDGLNKMYFGIYGEDNQRLVNYFYSSTGSLFNPVLKLIDNGTKIGVFYSVVRSNQIGNALRKIDLATGIEQSATGLFTVTHSDPNPNPKFMVENLANGGFVVAYAAGDNSIAFREYTSTLTLASTPIGTQIPFSDQLQLVATGVNRPDHQHEVFFFYQESQNQPIMQGFLGRELPSGNFPLVLGSVKTVVNSQYINSFQITSYKTRLPDLNPSANLDLIHLTYEESGVVKLQPINPNGVLRGSVVVVTHPDSPDYKLEYTTSIDASQNCTLAVFTDSGISYGQLICSDQFGNSIVYGAQFEIPADITGIIAGPNIDPNHVNLLLIGENRGQIARAVLNIDNVASPSPTQTPTPSFGASRSPSRTPNVSQIASISTTPTPSVEIIETPSISATPTSSPSETFSNPNPAPVTFSNVVILGISGGGLVLTLFLFLALRHFYNKARNVNAHKRLLEGDDDIELDEISTQRREELRTQKQLQFNQQRFILESKQEEKRLLAAHEFQLLIAPIIRNKATIFSLKSSKISNEKVAILASFLPNNHLLTSLDLSKNQISSEGAAAIIVALELSVSIKNHNLTNINLDQNPIPKTLKKAIQDFINHNQQIQIDFIDAVKQANIRRLEELFAIYPSRSSTHLEELYLIAIENNFQINMQSQDLDPNFKAVSQIIIEIISLNLSQNHPEYSIDQQKLDKAKSNALRKQPEIHKKHFFDLIVQIEQNQINYVNLQDYDIGDEGVIILVKALKINKSVTNINLANNKITNQGANYLISFLTGNKFIQNIDLLGNNIDDHLLTQIDELLLRNQQLQVEILKLKQLITQIESLPYQDIEFILPQLNKSNQINQRPSKIVSIIDQPTSGKIITCTTSVNGRQILQEIRITSDGNVLYKISNAAKPFEAIPLIPQDLSSIKNLTTNFTQILTNLKQSQFVQLDTRIKQQGGDQEFEQMTRDVMITSQGLFVRSGTQSSLITPDQLESLIQKACQVESKLTLLGEFKDFISHLAKQAKKQNGIVFGSDISSLYIEGEQDESERRKAIKQKQSITKDTNKKTFYTEFQSQLNSILRLMQSMNISNADRQVAVGESRKEKFLGLINSVMEFIPLAEEAAPYIQVGQVIIGELLGAYEQKQYQRSCLKISNLQGNGDYHIGLLSEILARLIITDPELLDKAKADLAARDSTSKMARIFSSIIIAPTMASRIADNKLSLISEEVIYLSTTLLEAIFEDPEFAKERQAINKDLANQLHSMLRIRMGLIEMRLIEDKPLTDSESEDDIKTPAGSSTDTMPEQRIEPRTESRVQSRPSIPLLLTQLTEVTKHRKQQLEDSGAVTESEVPADRRPIVTQNYLKTTQISQQFSLSVADIESIKLRSATTPLTPNKSRQESNPIAKQLDNLIKLLTLLKQEEYSDIEEEIRIAFYRQIKLTNIPQIRYQTNIKLLIQNLTEVKDNPDGDNFKEFRKRIKETGDIRNFLLNMSGDIDPQTLKRFNLIRLYKEIANGETATQIIEATSDDMVVAISSTSKDDINKGGFEDSFFEADFTSASGLFQSSLPSLTQTQSAEEKQKLEIIDRICRHSNTQDLRRIAEILDLSALHHRSGARFDVNDIVEEIELERKKQDNSRATKGKKLLVTKASRKQGNQDKTESDIDIEYKPLLVQRGMPNRDVDSSSDDTELEATDFTSKQHIFVTPITLADDKRTNTSKLQTTDTTSANTKPSLSPANIVGGRRHRRKGRGGRK